MPTSCFLIGIEHTSSVSGTHCEALRWRHSQTYPGNFHFTNFHLDGHIDNPLYSYKLQQALDEKVRDTDNRHSKQVGYKTVRYPLSGLVGTESDRKATQAHNEAYVDPTKNADILNASVAAWMDGTVKITSNDDKKPSPMPDTYCIFNRFKLCLDAPNYTVFSNTSSAAQWITDHGGDKPHYVVSLESPHNAIHLAVGGFYQKSDYNADPILGANGDMGNNETANLDPIFFFHHCFIDNTLWKWQQKHKLTAAGTLSVIKDPKEYAGTTTKEELPDIEPKTPLDMKTPLYPFKKPDGSWYTSFDVTDIENQLHYTYGPGSLDPMIRDGPLLGTPDCAPIVKIKKTHNTHRAQYAGSFVIRTYAKGPGTTEEMEIGRDAILSRWNVRGCTNCQSSLEV
ncbi:hypothetical protein MMC08_007890 [Hypocenomyce scalaris]|nr:hypothetical protein [Hypocenomyce scalaris]